MKNKLCLHGIDIKHQAHLLSLIKKIIPGNVEKYKVQEKYFSDNDMYKYRTAYYRPKIKTKIEILCSWGILLVSDKLLPIADITLIFDNQDNESLRITEHLLRCILGNKLNFILEEPNYTRRIEQLKGCYLLDSNKLYNSKKALTAVYCHLPWQLYGINKLWLEITLRGTKCLLLRQLRVKLRRLRSSIALVKPLLVKNEASYWQSIFKGRTNSLSRAREYDVALLVCSKINMRQQKEQCGVPQLTEVLTELREKEAMQIEKRLRLNSLTLELALFALWLYKTPDKLKNLKLDTFLNQRFIDWYQDILLLPQKYPDSHDFVQLHKIRIKIKRFRYALQCVPEVFVTPKLLRSLKHLQDLLGLLHDDYVNRNLLKEIKKSYPQIPQLHYEIALFNGWDQAKSDAALENLPDQWHDFIQLLDSWYEEYL